MKRMESLAVPHHIRLARHIVAITHQAMIEWAYLRGRRRDEAIAAWETEVLAVCRDTLEGSDHMISQLWDVSIGLKSVEVAPQFFTEGGEANEQRHSNENGSEPGIPGELPGSDKRD